VTRPDPPLGRVVEGLRGLDTLGFMPEAPFIPVVPAGGSGTRLWPLSRRDRPKFLLDLTGEGRSLLQLTLDRLAPLADRPPIVVTGRAHAAAVREQLGADERGGVGGAERPGSANGLGAVRVLAEPSARNSMPAIALAAALVEREEPDAVIGSFAADHLIEDEAAFARAVTAARVCRRAGAAGHPRDHPHLPVHRLRLHPGRGRTRR
jgi:mannose-1-phosphate guanylyltransferase